MPRAGGRGQHERWNAEGPPGILRQCYLPSEGTRLTELARRVGTSKQAVGQVVSELEDMGVLTREPDPEDGRAKRVCFTPAGRRSLVEGLAIPGELEHELAERLGPRRLRALPTGLLALPEALKVDPGAHEPQ